MITVDTISRHEFIGLETKIINSSNPQVIGLNGTIINETNYGKWCNGCSNYNFRKT